MTGFNRRSAFAGFFVLVAASASALAASPDIPVAVPQAPEGSAQFMAFRNLLWAISQLISLAIPALVLFSGLGGRLSRICARLTGGRRHLTLIFFALAYLVLNTVLAAPFDYYREHLSLGAMADQTTVQWAVGEIVTLGARSTAAVLFLWIPYELMVRSPRAWWLWTAAAMVPVVLLIFLALPVWVDPLTTAYHPLTDKTLYREIETLAARCGVHDIPVVVGGNDTSVVGLGPTNRIVLGEDLLHESTPDIIRSTVGHELKHYLLGDNYKGAAIIVALLLAGFFLADRLGRRIIARFRDRIGFSDLSDPASLPLIVLIVTALWLLVLPAFNLYARHIEHEADRFGLELTHENHAMAEQQAAYITREHDVPEWDTFFLIFRAQHPSDGDRIRFANSYHPWRDGKPLVYGNLCH